MTTYLTTLPITFKYTHNPSEPSSRTEPSVDEEFYIDSLKIGGVELSEFLTSEWENKLYEILKGKNNEP